MTFNQISHRLNLWIFNHLSCNHLKTWENESALDFRVVLMDCSHSHCSLSLLGPISLGGYWETFSCFGWAPLQWLMMTMMPIVYFFVFFSLWHLVVSPLFPGFTFYLYFWYLVVSSLVPGLTFLVHPFSASIVFVLEFCIFSPFSI